MILYALGCPLEQLVSDMIFRIMSLLLYLLPIFLLSTQVAINYLQPFPHPHSYFI